MTIREARESDASSMAKIHVDVSRSTFRGLLPDEILTNFFSYEGLEDAWRKDLLGAGHRLHHSYWVAEGDSGDVVGFAAAGYGKHLAGTYDSEVLAIYVVEKSHRMGVGRNLFTSMVQGLVERRKSSLVAWTLPGTPSCHFFAAVGGFALGEQSLAIGSVNVVQSGFEWCSLDLRPSSPG
jgi:L-amino acid N-acyltransferase YncA